MSQSYFPAGPGSTEPEPAGYVLPTQRSHEYAPPFGPEPVGYPPDANRGYPPDGARGYPSNTDHGNAGSNGGYAPHPNLGQPAYGMQPPTPPTPVPPTPAKPSLPRRAVAIIGVLGLVVVGLAGFTFMTHSSLAKAQSESAELSDSLKEANASVASQKKAVDAAKQDAAASQQAAADATAGLEAMQTCAAGLMEAWDRVFADDFDGATAVLNETYPQCQEVFGDNGEQ